MEAVWWKHRKAKKAHGFMQFAGVGMKPWIVSLCRAVRFSRGSFEHMMHEPFTDDMNESTEDFCEKCIEKFNETEGMPATKMKWPSVTCPKCKGQAWMTDSQFIIVCDHCKMNYALQQPLYDKEPEVQEHDHSEARAERPRPTLVGATDDKGDRDEIQDDAGSSDQTDELETSTDTDGSANGHTSA